MASYFFCFSFLVDIKVDTNMKIIRPLVKKIKMKLTNPNFVFASFI